MPVVADRRAREEQHLPDARACRVEVDRVAAAIERDADAAGVRGALADHRDSAAGVVERERRARGRADNRTAFQPPRSWRACHVPWYRPPAGCSPDGTMVVALDHAPGAPAALTARTWNS